MKYKWDKERREWIQWMYSRGRMQIKSKEGIEEEEALHMIDSTIHVRPHLGHSERTFLRSLCSFDRRPRTVCGTRIDLLYLCTFLSLFLYSSCISRRSLMNVELSSNILHGSLSLVIEATIQPHLSLSPSLFKHWKSLETKRWNISRISKKLAFRPTYIQSIQTRTLQLLELRRMFTYLSIIFFSNWCESLRK